MLVLSRKKGQSIELPGLEIVIRVIDVRKSKVQIGIEAPREFSIHRTEKQPPKEQATKESTTAKQQGTEKSTTRSCESADLPDGAGSAGTAATSCQPLEKSSHVAAGDENGNSGSIAPAELERISGELMRLEAQFSATAELAGDPDLAMAQQVASDAIQRIEGIRRSLRLANHGSPQRPAGPLAELVRIRSDVLQCLRQETPPADTQPETARETIAGYSIVGAANHFSI